MKNLSKYLDAFKSSSQILEGIKNRIFKQEHIEAEAAYRYAICKTCNLIDYIGKSCLAPGTQPCCSDCGCSLAFKTRSLSSECPKGLWDSLVSEEQEEIINKQIEDYENKN